MLAYLAMEQRAHTREKLSGLLWSDREQAQASNSLRHELVELRRAFDALEHPPLVIEGATVALAGFQTDVAAFERLAGSDAPSGLQAAADLYRGPFLDGVTIHDAMFEDWVSGERNRLHQVAIDLMDRLTECLEGPAAVTAANQLLSLNPLREASHRSLMLAYARQGEMDLALRQYHACRALLREELDVDPSAETEELLRDIRNGSLKPAVSRQPRQPQRELAAVATEHTKPLMAIMPFEVIGQDQELETISAGLLEDVTTGMARFRLISVASRHLTIPYKGRILEPMRIRQDLGARYLVAGSLRRSRDGMRATAQLIETESGRELWAERYDRPVQDAIEVQDELAQAIVAQLEHILVAAEHRRALSSGLGEQRIINQKAGWHLFRFTREDNARAIDLLRKAIAENPDADRRYQGLALALGLDLIFGWSANPQQTIVEMVAAAERCVSLREADAWNHAPLSWAMMFARQSERALADVKRMVELNPNSGVSYGVGSLILSHCGNASEALDFLAKARRMAPQAPFMFNYLCGGAIALCRLGRFAEAAEMAESSTLRRPNYFQPRLILAAALARLGERTRAEAALAAAHQLAPLTDEAWLRPLVPLRDTNDFAHLVDGLRLIGWKANR